MLLEIENLAVEVAGKRVLKDINLSIDEGETHVLLGPIVFNNSWFSTI